MKSKNLLTILVVLVVFVAACTSGVSQGADSTGNEDAGQEDRWPGDGAAMAVHELNHGYSIEGPADWDLSFYGPQVSNSGEPDCQYLPGRIGSLYFTIVGKGCVAQQSPGNGDSGHYLVPDQAPASDIVEHEIEGARFVTFDQTVFVCTNECNDEQERVGLFTPTDPPDPDFPVLMMVTQPSKRSVDEMIIAATALRVAPDWAGVPLESLEIIDGVGFSAPRGNTINDTGLSRARVGEEAGPECDVREVRVSSHTTFKLVGADCTGSQQSQKSRPGHYVNVESAVGATNVEVVEVEAGTLTIFDVPSNCESDCGVATFTVGLLALPAGASEDFPTLQFQGERQQIQELASAVLIISA